MKSVTLVSAAVLLWLSPSAGRARIGHAHSDLWSREDDWAGHQDAQAGRHAPGERDLQREPCDRSGGSTGSRWTAKGRQPSTAIRARTPSR